MRIFHGIVNLLIIFSNHVWTMVHCFHVICLCFKSDINNNPTEFLITSCLIIRPLPEEEELEDELFAGTSEEGDPGNENRESILKSILKLTRPCLLSNWSL